MLGIFFLLLLLRASCNADAVGWRGVGVLGLELFPGEGKGGVEGAARSILLCVKKRGGSRTKWY